VTEEEDDELVEFSDPCVEECWTITTLRCKCPKCKKVNYVDLGDFTDQTGIDIEVMECWSCGAKAWLDRDIRSEASGMGYETINDAHSEKGKELP
jgi:hypothetical protein